MSRVTTEGGPVCVYQASLDAKNRLYLKGIPDEIKFMHVKHYLDGRIVLIPLREPIKIAHPKD